MDLRDNPGGAVQAAVEIASLFLDPDQLVFSHQGPDRRKREEVRVPKLARRRTNFPLAVLINEKSASASEIVTGALQDHDRATVFGEPSYGKGLVQNVFPLSGNTGVALTIAYLLHAQRPIHPEAAAWRSSRHGRQPAPEGFFHTDSGREVRGGGGIQPDEVDLPERS